MKVQYNISVGCDTYFIQMLTSTGTSLFRANDKTSVTSRWLLVDDHSSCRCYCTKTGNQPWTLQRLSPARPLWSTTSPKAHPGACWAAVKEQRYPHQQELQGQSSSYPVLRAISKQRLTEYNSQILRESDGHHGETLSVSTGYQLCPAQSLHEWQKESFCHHSQKIIWGHVFLPLFYKRQGRRLPNFLQQAVNKPCQFLWIVVSMISCRGRVNKSVATETKTFLKDMATEQPSLKFCRDAKKLTTMPCGTTVEQY